VLPSVSGIYAIVHLATGRRYVGSAVNIRRRVARHASALRAGKHWSRHLQAAWNRYSEKAFSFIVIELCGPGDLIRFEQHHIDLRSEFNLAKVAGNTIGVKATPEMIAKLRARTWDAAGRANISAATKRGMNAPGVREKIRAALIGIPLSAEHRAKISYGNKGKTISPEQRAKISTSRRTSAKVAEANRARIGIPLTTEHRAKISAARLGYKLSEAHRLNLSLSHIGKPWSEARRKAALC